MMRAYLSLSTTEYRLIASPYPACDSDGVSNGVASSMWSEVEGVQGKNASVTRGRYSNDTIAHFFLFGYKK
jgi:hypothetical protein